MDTKIQHTSHSARQQVRRNLSDQDIEFVFEHGRRVPCAGALHVFLGRRDIPTDKPTYQRFGHLEGAVLVINDTRGDVVLITAYRNRQGLKQIRCKQKYDQSGED